MRKLATLLLIGISTFTAKAQFMRGADWSNGYPVPRGPKNTEIGLSYCITSGTFSNHTTSYNENTATFKDSSYSRNIHTVYGYGAMFGYYWPVAKMAEKSRLAIDFAFMYNALFWESGSFGYSYSSQGGSESIGSATIQLAVPIGLDYKFGCDALYDKSQRFCASAGIGFMPSMDLTVYQSEGGFGFHSAPYIKGEVGVFGGICFKLRATYRFGSTKFIDEKDDNSNSTNETTLKVKSNLTLTLIFMPMSWKWNRS